jgi:hypothetical protein
MMGILFNRVVFTGCSRTQLTQPALSTPVDSTTLNQHSGYFQRQGTHLAATLS